MKLSENFSLDEFLVSQTAERHGGDMLREQRNPEPDIVSNLDYLVESCLQPLRTLLRTSMSVSSGYRCEALNQAIGGSTRSQHCRGEAADLKLSERLLESDSRSLRRVRRIIENQVRNRTGREIRAEANANFYLFAATCIYLNDLDVDQVIHEYGEDGQPGWVHISSSQRKNARQILLINRGRREELTLEEALLLGC